MSRFARRLLERLAIMFDGPTARSSNRTIRFAPVLNRLEGRDVPAAPPAPPGFTATTTSFTNSTPVTIATTAPPQVLTSTITVSGAGSYLHDLDLTTFIQHTYAGDLDVTLTSPSGTVVTITTDNGGVNDNVFNGTVWDDDADPGSTLPYTNSVNTVGDALYANLTVRNLLTPEEALGAFRGENPNGVWTLTISDDASGDGGSLDSWKLDLATLPTDPGMSGPQTFTNSTPVTITTAAPPQVLTSTITVSGAGTYIQKLTLQTFIQHTYAGDLDVTLTSPSGTVVTITTDNGGVNDNVFNGTVWDDDADPGSTLPYTNSVNTVGDALYANLTVRDLLTPEEALAAFIGENPNGVWTLTISDDANGDGGSLDSWKLNIFGANASNPPPVISAPATLTVAEDSTANAVTGVTVTDGDTITVTVTAASGTLSVPGASGNGTGAVTFTGTPSAVATALAGLVYSPALDFFGATTITISATDSAGGTATPKTITVTVTEVNDAPTAGNDTAAAVVEDTPTVTIPISTLLANDTRGPGEGSQTLTVTAVGGAVGGTVAIVGSNIVFTPSANFNGPASFTYTVTDNGTTGGAADPKTATATVSFTVTEVNDTPTAVSDSVPDIAVNSGPYTIPASAIRSNDSAGPPNESGQTLTVTAVTLTAGMGTVSVVAGNVVFTPAANFVGAVTLTYTVTDNGTTDGVTDPKTATATISFDVTPVNNPPSITSNGGGATATVSVVENATAVTTVTATDPDGDTLTYSISGGVDASKFAIDPLTGALTFVGAPDFEGPTDAGGDNVYDVIVAATDSGTGFLADVQAIAVTVTGVNEAPVVTSPGTASAAENGTAVTTVTAADPEGGAVTFSISGGVDASKFAIDPLTGALTFVGAPDFEGPTDAGGDNVYDVVVTVTDGSGLSSTLAVAVTVTGVNEAPVVTSPGTASAAENGTAVTVVTAADPEGGALTYGISGGVDASKFAIDPLTGALTFVGAPDFEGPTDAGGDNVYDVIVTATDGGGLSATRAIAVTVTGVNDSTPVLTLPSVLSVEENSTFVTRAAAVDADAPSQALTFSITGGADAAKFVIDPLTGELTFVGVPNFELPTDAGGDNVYDLVVSVSDNGTPARTVSQSVSVTVTNGTDSPVKRTGTAATAQFIAVGTDAGALGTVRVLDAATRTPVRDFIPFEGYRGGIEVALGDVDGDGREDLVVGTATGNSHVKVFDIATGALLRSFLAFPGFGGGVSLAAGDVDGDGRADIVVGTATGNAHVKVLSGATGEDLLSVITFSEFTGGVKVATGDVTGDGRADIAVLAAAGGNGHVKVIDGKSGELATSFFGYTGYLGNLDLAVGDTNGDGTSEVITLAQNQSGDRHVKAFDARADLMESFLAPVSRALDYERPAPVVPPQGTVARLAVADVTGDQVVDYLFGSQPGVGYSRLVVLDGATSTTATQFAFDPLFDYGVFVAAR